MKVNLGEASGKKFDFELNNLTKHVAVVGTTGSGKTVMCKVLIEEALQKNIPVIAIDPKGDIASLAITNKEFDFRPFVNKTEAQRIAQKYLKENLDVSNIESLKNTKTKIFTPKSTIGIPISLMPDLKAPKHFKDIIEDPTLIADFVEPISETLLDLSEIKTNIATVQSFISQILIHNWSEEKDLNIPLLIEQVLNPPFEKVGSLNLDDVINEKDRKKIAANLNLLVSSPAKKVWANGENFNVSNCFTPGSLSVFDLRYSSSNHDKQLVVGVVMQEIYKFLISRGGSEKLKFVLYIDELAGIFPPAPANPPTKKLLELLIRQARAFGLGIILATQNPGDIDYKVLSNLGTRFIGKLRTEQDIEKVASSTEIPASNLKNYVSRLHVGDFIYNDSIKNSTTQIKARWLYSYHGGPLTSQQISWINNPESLPEVSGRLDIKELRKPKSARILNVNEEISLIEGVELDEIIKKISPHFDSLKVLRSSTESRVYKPVLQVSAEAKKWKGIEMPLIGPWNYDLTKRKKLRIKDEEFVNNKLSVKVMPVKVDIKSIAEVSLNKTLKKLEKNYYKSTIFNTVSKKKGQVVKDNEKFLMDLVKDQTKKLEAKKKKKILALKQKIKTNNQKKKTISSKLKIKRTKRALTNLLTDKNLASRTKQMNVWKRNIQTLERHNKAYKNEIEAIKKKTKIQSKRLVSKAKIKAKTHTSIIKYSPPRAHLSLDAKLILIPEY